MVLTVGQALRDRPKKPPLNLYRLLGCKCNLAYKGDKKWLQLKLCPCGTTTIN